MAPTRQITPTRRRFTTAEYYRMAEAGILRADERLELIAGEIVAMGVITPRHADTVAELTDLAITRTGQTARISVRNPIHLDPHTEPLPDLALIKHGRYPQQHPTPRDIFLVIEVADYSLDNVKLSLYAAANIPESWLVDLGGRTAARHTEPRDGRYTRIAIATGGDFLSSTILGTLAFCADELFPDAAG